MITREEAYIIGESIKVPSMEQRSDRIKEFVNTIYNSFEQHIKSLEAKLSNTEQLTCEWVKDNNGEEYELLPVFYTKCGSSFVFSECGIKENNFLFCPYCGGKITQKDTQ